MKAKGFNFSPQKNLIKLYNKEKDVTFVAPPLSEEDIFNSHPQLGTLAYRLPSITELFQGVPAAAFDSYHVMTFKLEVWADTIFPEPALLKCAVESYCTFKMVKDYTPMIHYLSPRVTYYESYTQIMFNPKNTMNLIKDLDMDEMPFINAKIGGNLVDFEMAVDSATEFRAHSMNRARGQIGENTIGKKQDITMMWETGRANIAKHESTFCSFDQSDCYQAKSVPVIFGISENKGYITGG
jgi:hypothetical protein